MGTDIKTSEFLLNIVAQIKTLLEENPVATPNPSVVNRLNFLASQASAKDQYAARHIYKIAELADIFYSDRKHEKYRGGADRLWAAMTFDHLGRIKSQASNREMKGD